VKLRANAGVLTHVITAAVVTEGSVNDSPIFSGRRPGAAGFRSALLWTSYIRGLATVTLTMFAEASPHADA
jgi:hypothetical protein